MYKCKYCNKKFEKYFQVGSHTRTCKSRPDYKQIIEKISLAVSATKQQKKLEKYGKLIKKIVTCTKCKKEFEVDECEFVTKEKYFCSRKCANSRELTSEIKNKISKKLKGRTYPERHISQITKRICPYCNKDFFRYKKKQTTCGNKICKSKHLSLILKGKTGGYRVRSGHWKNGSYYKNFWMDSSWELEFAKHLDSLNLNWIKNTKTSFKYIGLDSKEHRYYPDFYLKDRNCFIEIKGYWDKKSIHKMNEIKKLNLKLIIIDKKDELTKFV